MGKLTSEVLDLDLDGEDATEIVEDPLDLILDNSVGQVLDKDGTLVVLSGSGTLVGTAEKKSAIVATRGRGRLGGVVLDDVVVIAAEGVHDIAAGVEDGEGDKNSLRRQLEEGGSLLVNELGRSNPAMRGKKNGGFFLGHVLTITTVDVEAACIVEEEMWLAE